MSYVIFQVFFKDYDGKYQPSPAPVLSRSPATPSTHRLPHCGEHTTDILSELGLSSSQIKQLIVDGIVDQHHHSKL